jgi:eukaryotic-like serine/threonine-protein kinase
MDMESNYGELNGLFADAFLSRAGTAMGTAAYMAPEQVRGEKIDARTDVFSFGLVLYEMATGQRAFAGDTELLLQSAILQSTPPRVRELNAKIPQKLEQIINKAIAKEPSGRYQTAAQLREELRILRSMTARSRFSRGKVIGAACVLGIFVLAARFWLVPSSPRTEPGRQFKQRQLTVNSSENPVTGGEISPDGKYLLYSDLNGIYLKPIGGGEPRAIMLPEVSKAIKPNWQLGSWHPDSSRFFAIAELPQKPSSLWNISITGRGHRKLGGGCQSVGRFARWVAGEHARKLYEVDRDSHFRAVQWSPSGHRLAYIKISPRSGAQIELGDPEGGPPTVFLSGAAAGPLLRLRTGLEI